MSKNMSSTNRRYEAANKKFDEAYNKYAGEASLNSATNYANTQAQEQANAQSLRAGTQAGAAANKSARTSGLSKAQAALMSEQAASDTTGNTYSDVYNQTRNSSLNGALQNNQAATNARGTQLQSSQQEGQNAYNRAWGNVGGVGSMVTGFLTSDERLKEARDVSSDANTEDYECFKCNIGSRRTSLADTATDLSTSIASDERLKTFREVSKSLNTNPKTSSYDLLKVTYKHNKGE